MEIKWKVTKKKLQPFLDERGLELRENTTSYCHHYYLIVKGASIFSSEYIDDHRFNTLKDVLIFLLTSLINAQTIIDANKKS